MCVRGKEQIIKIIDQPTLCGDGGGGGDGDGRMYIIENVFSCELGWLSSELAASDWCVFAYIWLNMFGVNECVYLCSRLRVKGNARSTYMNIIRRRRYKNSRLNILHSISVIFDAYGVVIVLKGSFIRLEMNLDFVTQSPM